MNLLELFIGQDISTYNMDMVFVYVLVLIVAFIVCVIWSNKLNVYSPKMNKEINNIVTTLNCDSLTEVLDEVAATLADTRGEEDEQ